MTWDAATVDMIVVVSDTHLGTEDIGPGYANRGAFTEFLCYVRDELQPDHLILNGDIEDLWRRDMRSVTRDDFDVFAAFEECSDRGIDVHYVLGNHDWYARKDTAAGRRSFYETDYEPELVLEYGETTYAFVHGHQFDPGQDPWYFDKLALVSDDVIGASFSQKWAMYTEARSYLSALKTALKLYRDRITRGKLADRITRMDRCQTACDAREQYREARRYVREEPDVDVICTGHTHHAAIIADESVANSGSWVADETTFLILEETPTLMDWNNGDPVEDTERMEV